MKKILLASCLIFLAACTTQPADDSPIVIGGIVALTGSDGEYGQEDRNTAELRIKQINDAGGINGREIKVLWRDGQCITPVAKEAATRLIEEDQVNIILGGTCSASTLGISEVVNIEHVLQIAHGGASAKISEAGPYTFRTIPSNTGESRAINRYLGKRKIGSLGVLLENREYTNSIQKKLNEIYKGVVYEQVFSGENINLKNVIKDISADKPEAIFINIYNKALLSEIFDRLIAEEFKGVVMFNTEVLSALRSGGPILEKLSYFSEVIATEYYGGNDSPRLMEFVGQYEEYYETAPKAVNYMGMMIDAVDVLAGVLEVVEDNTDDIDKLREAMSIVQHVGVSRPIAFDENGDLRVEHQVLKLMEGEFVLLPGMD